MVYNGDSRSRRRRPVGFRLYAQERLGVCRSTRACPDEPTPEPPDVVDVEEVLEHVHGGAVSPILHALPDHGGGPCGCNLPAGRDVQETRDPDIPAQGLRQHLEAFTEGRERFGHCSLAFGGMSPRLPAHVPQPLDVLWHDAGLDYPAYLATDEEKAARWREFAEGVSLTDDQRRLIESFSCDMKVLVISGIWCGDCVQQGPLLQAIADASACIDLKWVDRDEHADLAERVMINQGLRVPVALFLAEDYEPVSIYGDRTLTRYRAMAAKQLGPSCPLPGAPVPPDEVTETLQDWLDEFERVQLLLRLSGRLRQKHGD